MKSKFDIEQEVQKTMSALDELKRVDGNPYLFTRIKAQLEKQQEPEVQKKREFSSVLSWSTMLLLLVVNIIAIRGNLNTETIQDSFVESIASDYGFEEEKTDYFTQD